MDRCTMCLLTMEVGQGTAIFTAECSHSFHFNCTYSYVKQQGNKICPICGAQWKDIPFHINPTLDLDLSLGLATTINPVQVQLPQVINATTTNRFARVPFRRIKPLIGHIPDSSEPSVFNDDDTLDSQPQLPLNHSVSSKFIDIKTTPEVEAVQQSTCQEKFNVLVNLKAKANTTQNAAANDAPHVSSRAPIDLVTVLDVSGSMTGTKIELLKRAMGFVIRNLGSNDRLSVIAFSSTAHRLFPLRRMTDSGQQYALQGVNSLCAGGATNIFEGLRKGGKVIEDRREKNLVCSIMLLSDGQDSYRDKVLDIRRNLSLQVPIHTFGFGTDHDPALLHSISEACKGTFSFIEDEGFIQDAFAQCIGGLLSIVVQDLQVHVQAVHPNVRLRELKAGNYTTNVINDNRTGSIDVGDLYADEERDFLVLVNVPVFVVGEDSDSNSNDTTTNLVNVWCVYKDPFSKETMSTTEVKQVKIERPEEMVEEADWYVVSIEVDRQRNRLQAAEAMAEARAAAERSDLSSAWSILEGCQKTISETVSSIAGDPLSVALDAELEEVRMRMANMRTYHSSGRAYVLSGMSSHSRQRATTRKSLKVTTQGASSDATNQSYQTPAMFNMVSRSQMSHPIVQEAPNSSTKNNQQEVN